MLVILITCFIVAADQVTKLLVRQGMAIGENIDFIPWFINLTHTENTGAAWGMLADSRWVFLIFSSLAIIAIIIFLCRHYKHHRLLNIGLAFVLGGGIGNMIDRIFIGSVTDFFYFTFFDFPVFNVADMFVTFGAIILGVYLVFFEQKLSGNKGKTAKANSQPDNKVSPSEGDDKVTDDDIHSGT